MESYLEMQLDRKWSIWIISSSGFDEDDELMNFKVHRQFITTTTDIWSILHTEAKDWRNLTALKRIINLFSLGLATLICTLTLHKQIFISSLLFFIILNTEKFQLPSVCRRLGSFQTPTKKEAAQKVWKMNQSINKQRHHKNWKNMTLL